MIVIGVDVHKQSVTAVAIDRVGRMLDEKTVVVGSDELVGWASAHGSERRWAVENACRLGRHLALWLVAREETVDDVPSTATTRVGELSRGGRCKNGVIARQSFHTEGRADGGVLHAATAR